MDPPFNKKGWIYFFTSMLLNSQWKFSWVYEYGLLKRKHFEGIKTFESKYLLFKINL